MLERRLGYLWRGNDSIVRSRKCLEPFLGFAHHTGSPNVVVKKAELFTGNNYQNQPEKMFTKHPGSGSKSRSRDTLISSILDVLSYRTPASRRFPHP